MAAALTTITVGTLSLAVSQRLASRPDVGATDATVVETVATHQVGVPTDTPPASPTGASRRPASPTRSTARAAAPVAQLSFGGDVSDLDDASIRALLGALDEIDRAPIAPSAEPDRAPVLPVIKEGQR